MGLGVLVAPWLALLFAVSVAAAAMRLRRQPYAIVLFCIAAAVCCVLPIFDAAVFIAARRGSPSTHVTTYSWAVVPYCWVLGTISSVSAFAEAAWRKLGSGAFLGAGGALLSCVLYYLYLVAWAAAAQV